MKYFSLKSSFTTDMRKFRALCVKDVTGDIEEDEKQILKNWLSLSVVNKREYDKIRMIWTGSAPGEVEHLPDIDTEWLALNNRITAVGTEYRVKENFNTRKNYLKLKPALIGAFAILLLFSGLFLLNNLNKPAGEVSITQSSGSGNKEILMSDGSTVLLKSKSTLKYLKNFGSNKREVYLDGEAFFSVTKNGYPFTVMTRNAKTTVLGTKFSIRAAGEKTEVFVKEGKVSVSQNKSGTEKVILIKNQLSSVVKDQKPSLPQAYNPNDLAWIDGKLIFTRTPLPDVIDQIEKFYDVQVNIKEKNLAERTLTGTFKNNSIDSVLTMICLSLDADYDKSKDGYVIKPKGPDK